MTAAIEAIGLTKRYGRKAAVRSLSLTVPEGAIYALLGPNGSGKTTCIKMLMNIIETSSGASTVLGVDSRRLGPQQFAQIGYVSENQDLPEWMTLGQLLDYCRPMYPTWNDAFCAELVHQLQMPLDQKLKRMSRGMRVKAALISSIAYRPRLLVMDEPFSGLDPLVREEVVRGILEVAQQERWTIFISSHDIDEVERLADWVAVVNEGRIQLAEPIESLQARFRRIEVTFPPGATLATTLPAYWILPERAGQLFTFVDTQHREEEGETHVRSFLGPSALVAAHRMSLREIFLALARTYRLVL